MKNLTCIIIGGGHAGINAVKSIQQETQRMSGGRRVQIVLFDRQPEHVRKAMLFRPAAGVEKIRIPWNHWLREDDKFVQGTVTTVDNEKRQIRYTDAKGNEVWMPYDLLVVAAGSVVRQPDPSKGGIAMAGPQASEKIFKSWRENLRKAVSEMDPKERKRLMTVAVVGGGISGIETSSELALAMRKEAKTLGLQSSEISVNLLSGQERLFMFSPKKVGRKLDKGLKKLGVTVFHNCKAVRENAGVVTLSNGDQLSVGLCIWTIGLMPNPIIRNLGLPVTPDGRVQVDECYRVKGMQDIYSIGDGTKIVDPKTGKEDQMTCKEGGVQGVRVGKIIKADLEGLPAPVHKEIIADAFCIALGENHGLLWLRKWGLNIILTGKLAWKSKRIAWQYASALQKVKKEPECI